MAPVQTARLPLNGPSWDEEVVPALRKRLESESLTLAKRISAISLSSQDDIPSESPSASTYIVTRDTPATPFFQSNASASARLQYQQSDTRASLDRIPTSNSRVPNGVTSTPTKRKLQSSSPTPSFQRSRTYSQPYLTELSSGKQSRTKPHSNTHTTSKSSRIPESKPTRIPQPTPRSTSSVASGAHSSKSNFIITAPNGNHQYTISTPPEEPIYGSAPAHKPIAGLQNYSTNSVNVNTGLGLLHEPPPFNPASASSSITPSPESEHDPVRPSMDSEEHPFEHWYRGEVSRNGGVGELRIGRRQEMLDIANYGHTIREVDKRKKKRADSVSGRIGLGEVTKEVRRESLYLEDYDAKDAELVMDEPPLTDLEGSDGRANEIYGGYEMSDEDRDDFRWAVNNQSSEATPRQVRSTTPTSFPQIQQRPSSRNANVPSSRIPARSRQSSESHVTSMTTQLARGASEATIASPNTTPKSTLPPPMRQRQQSKPTPTGRVTSKSRSPAPKAIKAKTMASKKELENDAKRRSIAYYPTPGEGDETIIDAIPTWTQPVIKEGNWDEVVLPAVARKKGLEEHYQKVDGKPAPRRRDNAEQVAPAPGTFGFDHSKYHPTRPDIEPGSIPMYEFGLSAPGPALPAAEDSSTPNAQITVRHNKVAPPEHTQSPHLLSEHPQFRPVAPAVDTTSGQLRQGRQDELQEKDEDGGCCKCIIM